MGLDAVEIVMEIEEAFGITLEEGEAAKMATPRDLVEAVCRKVGQADSPGCLTQRAFQLVRKSLMIRLGLRRAEIGPTVPLATLVGKERRAGLLQELAEDLKTGPLPELERPAVVLGGLALVSLALGVLAGARLQATALQEYGAVAFLLGLGVAVGAQTCAWFATAPLRVHFPRVIATAGDLARWVTAHKTDLARPAQAGWT